MKNLDILEIEKNNPESIDEFKKFLLHLKTTSFMEKAQLHRDWEKAEAAVLQRFINLSKLATTSGNAGSIETDITSPVNVDQIIAESTDTTDVEMKFYLPLSSRQAQGWTGHLRRSTIPRNREFFSVKFDWHEKLSANYPELVPVLEASWKDYLMATYNRIKAPSKITKAQLQSVIFGNTCMYLEYSEDLGLVDAHVINVRDMAIHSAKEDINRSKLMINYQVPITDLLDNPSLDKEITDELKMSMDLASTGISYHSQETTYLENTEIADYGMINLSTLFIPYWVSRENPKLHFKNILVTIAEGQSEDKDKICTILRAIELDSREQNPILFATFGPTPAGTVYYQSKILQNLPYQAMANLATSTAMQALLVATFPPLKVIDDGTMTADSFNWYPRAIWSIRTKDDVEQMDIKSDLNAYIALMGFIEQQVQKGSGITEINLGQRTSTVRKTLGEVEQEKQAGDVPIDYIIEHQNDNLMQPFVFKHTLLSQTYIEAEVENLLFDMGEEEKKNGTKMDELKKWQYIRANSRMFRNFLIYSKIEEKIDNKMKDLYRIDPEKATELQSILNPAFIYSLIITKFTESNIIIEGNTAEATKRELKEDLLELLQLAPTLMLEQRTGKPMDGNEILRLLDKVYNLPISKLFKSMPQILQENPAAVIAAAGGQAVAPNTQLPQAAAQPPQV